MLDLSAALNFSHTHCIAICAFLVPANLLATVQTLLVFVFQRPPVQVRLAAILASSFAIAMILHVCSWLFVGVVRVPTFILLGLGTSCLIVNGCAIALVGIRERILERSLDLFVLRHE